MYIDVDLYVYDRFFFWFSLLLSRFHPLWIIAALTLLLLMVAPFFTHFCLAVVYHLFNYNWIWNCWILKWEKNQNWMSRLWIWTLPTKKSQAIAFYLMRSKRKLKRKIFVRIALIDDCWRRWKWCNFSLKRIDTKNVWNKGLNDALHSKSVPWVQSTNDC